MASNSQHHNDKAINTFVLRGYFSPLFNRVAQDSGLSNTKKAQSE